MRYLFYGLLILIGTLLSACNALDDVAGVLPFMEGTWTETPSPTATAIQIPSATPTETLSPSPEPTLTPTTTPSATPQQTETTPTSIPWSDKVITSDNALQVTQRSIWGKGVIQEAENLDHDKKIAIQTPFGVYIYDRNDLKALSFFEKAEFYKISHNTQLLAIVYPGGIVELWDAASLERAHRFEHHTEVPTYPPPDFDINDLLEVRTTAFSPDDRLIAVGFGDNKIELFRTDDGSLSHVYESILAPSPNSVLFSPDGAYLVSDNQQRIRLSYKNTVAIWSVENGELLSYIKEAGMLGKFPFHPDSTKMVASQFGGFVLIYTIPKGELIFSFGIGYDFPRVDFSLNGKFLLINEGQQVRNVSNGNLVPGTIQEEIFHPEKPRVAFTNNTKWSLMHFEGMRKINVTPDSLNIFGVLNPLIYKWELFDQAFTTYKLDAEVLGVDDLSLSSDGKKVATCVYTSSMYRSIFSITLESGEVNLLGNCRGSIFFLSDSDLISKNNPYFVDIIETTAGNLVRSVRDQKFFAFSPNGQYFLTESNDGKTLLWKSDLSKRYPFSESPPGMGNLVVVSPDKRYAVTSGNKLRFWRLSDGWQEKYLSIWAGSLAFSLDGTILVVGDTAGTLHLLEFPSGVELGQLVGHKDSIVDLQITPDGKNIISASSDGTLRLWGINP